MTNTQVQNISNKLRICQSLEPLGGRFFVQAKSRCPSAFLQTAAANENDCLTITSKLIFQTFAGRTPQRELIRTQNFFPCQGEFIEQRVDFLDH